MAMMEHSSGTVTKIPLKGNTIVYACVVRFKLYYRSLKKTVNERVGVVSVLLFIYA